MLIGNFMTSLFNVAKYGFFSIFLYIDSVVYKIVSMLFSVFFSLAELQLLKDDAYQAISSRIYLLVGIVALFSITISLLKALVNPDNLGKGTISSFKNLIVSMLLVILMPTIFKYAFSFQAAIINDGVINNLFNFSITTGENEMVNECNNPKDVSVNTADNETLSSEINMTVDECQANYITMTVLQAFFSPSNDNVTNNYGTTWKDARRYIWYTGDFDYIATFAEQVNKGDSNSYITYYIIITTIAGFFLGYVILSFCLDLGIRAFKLAFYELIAPLPILMKIVPGQEGKFDKWRKEVVSTFLEVFVRLIIISFIIFMCGNLFKLIDGEEWGNVGILTKAILALGLFAFAKQAPKLLKDALGLEGAGVRLGIKGKLADAQALTAASALGAGVTALTRNGSNAFKNGWNNVKDANGLVGKTKAFGKSVIGGAGSIAAGTVSGFARGAKAGWSAKNYSDVSKSAGEAAKAAIDKRNDRTAYKAAHGGNTIGVIKGHAQDVLGGVANWATGGISAILDKVKAEEDFTNSYSDVESLFETPQYKSYKAQLDNLKTLRDQGEKVTSTGVDINEAIKKLNGQMLYNRVSSMSKNTNEFAYAMMNINKEAKKNPGLLKSIGISGANMDELDNFVLKGDQVINKKTGNNITADDLMHIYEGSGMNNYSVTTSASGDIELNEMTATGMRTYTSNDTLALGTNIVDAKDGVKAQKTKAKNAARNDKISITYKEATKNQSDKK